MPSVASEIVSGYHKLGSDLYVAVRSSGTAEDLDGASFAGLHDTDLDIRGDAAVIDAVKRCWASLWTARAVSYRKTQGFNAFPSIAIVVQQMVESEVSGVMFTGNPINTATDELMINASWGLGEAVVSGIVTPDEYIVSHRNLKVLQKTLGSKKVQVIRDTEKGVGTIIPGFIPEPWGKVHEYAPTWVELLVALGIWLLVHRTTLGRSFRAIGYSPEGARYAGIPVRRNLGLAYVLAGAIAGLAAVIFVARLGEAWDSDPRIAFIATGG
mgnify:CR=1 FL=1